MGLQDIRRQSVIGKLKGLYVDPHLLLLLYQIILYSSTCSFNMLSVTNRTELTRISNMAAKIIGLPTPNLAELNSKDIARIATSIFCASTVGQWV